MEIGRTAYGHLLEISKFHRVRGTEGYEKAVEYVFRILKKVKGVDVELVKIPADGRTRVGMWKAEPLWEVERAVAKVVEPEEMMLADFSECPVSLVYGTNGEFSGRYEVVDVGGGTAPSDYARDVRGRVVLASGRLREVYEQAVERRGAVGILTDSMFSQEPLIGRSPKDLPDAVNYHGIFAGERSREHFAFSIPHFKARKIRGYIKEGRKVVVEVDVKVRFARGKTTVVSALIPGSGEEAGEIVLVSHLCHPMPGSNDNASGSALLLALVQAMRRRFRSPKVSIRFLWVPEMYGTVMFYRDRESLAEETFFGICLDMVGEDWFATRSTLTVQDVPWSVPHYISDLVFWWLEELCPKARFLESPKGTVPLLHVELVPYLGGSDHAVLVSSPLSVPTVEVGFWPDRYYHTNLDSPDRSSEGTLDFIGRAVISAVEDFLEERNVVDRLFCVFLRRLEKYLKGRPGKRSLQLFFRNALERARSLSDGFGDEQVEALEGKIRDVWGSLFGRAEEEAGGRQEELYPVKNFWGPVNLKHLENILPPEKKPFWRRNASQMFVVNEATNLMDGTRTIAEIVDTVKAEYPWVGEKTIIAFVQDLSDLGYVKWEG